MEDILRSIEPIKVSPKKLRGCILQSELHFFVLIHCIIYAPINRYRSLSQTARLHEIPNMA